MGLRPIPSKPTVELEKSGKPTQFSGGLWQTYIAVDEDDHRTWEHNEDRDQWYVLVEEGGAS